MTVGECENFVGTHHYGFIPYGMPDDGFGNGIKCGVLQMLHYFQGWAFFEGYDL